MKEILELAFKKVDEAYEKNKIKTYTELSDIIERMDELTDEEYDYLCDDEELNEYFDGYHEQVMEDLEDELDGYYEQEMKNIKRDRQALESEYRRSVL